MQAALHFKTTILPGGKVEVTSPELPSGEPVDVIVLLPEMPAIPRRSAVDIPAEAPAQPKKAKHRLEDLIGCLQHEGPRLPDEVLFKPVDYSTDWEESEKRSRLNDPPDVSQKLVVCT